MTVSKEVLEQYLELDDPGSKPVYVELIERFLKSSPKKIEALRAQLGERDCNEIYLTAHALKGSAGNVGATQLADTCAELESAGREGKFDECQKLATLLFGHYDEAVQLLDRVRVDGLEVLS